MVFLALGMFLIVVIIVSGFADPYDPEEEW